MARNSKQKELKNEYKRNHPRMGVYQIRNLKNDKVLIGSTLNLQGMLNRQKFELTKGSHSNRGLQREWQEDGGDQFVFEILDELSPRSEPGYDYRADLAFLEEQWLEQVKPYGERGYNERKKSTEQKLREIAEKRRMQE